MKFKISFFISFTFIFVVLNTFIGIYDLAANSEVKDVQYIYIAVIMLGLSFGVAVFLIFKDVIDYLENNEKNNNIRSLIGVSKGDITRSNLKKYYSKTLISFVLGFALSIPISYLLKHNVDDVILVYSIPIIITLGALVLILPFLIFMKKINSTKIKKSIYNYYKFSKARLVVNIIFILLFIASCILANYIACAIIIIFIDFKYLITTLIYKKKEINKPISNMVTKNILSKYSHYKKKISSSSALIVLSLIMTLWVRGTFTGINNFVEDNYDYKTTLLVEDSITDDNFENLDKLESDYLKTFYHQEVFDEEDLGYNKDIVNIGNSKLPENICYDKDEECIQYDLKPGETIINSFVSKRYDVEKGDMLELNILGKKYEYKVAMVNHSFNLRAVYINNEELLEETGYNYFFFEDNIEKEDIDYKILKHMNEDEISQFARDRLFNSQEIIEIVLLMLNLLIIFTFITNIRNYLKYNKNNRENIIRIGIEQSSLRNTYIFEYLIVFFIVFLKVAFTTFVAIQALHYNVSMSMIAYFKFDYPFILFASIYVIYNIVIMLYLKLKLKEEEVM